MQNMGWKLVLIVAVLALCGAAVQFKDLRLGKDLRGGVSLIYKVNVGDVSGARAQEILTETITVLKDRVNPAGVFDISMEPVGRDRIEIIMPLPSKDVREKQLAFEQALNELAQRSEIRPRQLDDALRRDAAPAELSGDLESERGRKIEALQKAYFSQISAREALQQAKADGAADPELAPLQSMVATAEIKFEDLRAEVLELSLSETRIRRTLKLSPDEVQQVDDEGNTVRDADGKVVELPSPRETELTSMKEEYPQLAAQIDRVVKTFDAYQEVRTGYDDAEDLKRMLRGAGVLEFRIAVQARDPGGVNIDELRLEMQENGPDHTSSPLAKWFPINELKQWYETPEEFAALEDDPIRFFEAQNYVADVYEGQHYLLLWNTTGKKMTHDGPTEWSIAGTSRSVDQLGRPAVAFVLDSAGAGLMSRLTSTNLQKPMAIVLDGQVYSAPNIRTAISKNGQITGSFSQPEVDYLIKVLSAGALSAQLEREPISENIIGPTLGADNLKRGKEAFIIAIIAIAVFMVVYYFFAGIVAVLALAANGLIIFGVMMGIDGTFTLPGLAGIILTIGMAVDANVLIYERIREEIYDDELDLRGCVRQGYKKALSTILDANITNLVVCAALWATATTEVKGFALTLSIGICATLFTALFVTRQFFYFYTDRFKIRKLPMLATVMPAVHRTLEPSINWIGLQRLFIPLSVIAIACSIALIAWRGVNMLDTEFRGGVSITMATVQTGPPDDGASPDAEPQRKPLPHTGVPDSVEERVHALGANVPDPETATSDEERMKWLILREMPSAAVLTVGDTQTIDGVAHGTRFKIKVPAPRDLGDEATISQYVVNAIVDEFGNELDVVPELDFDGANNSDYANFVFPIIEPELGENIGVPSATQRVMPQYTGGAAIVLRNINPVVSLDEIAKRIERMRRQPDFESLAGRQVEVFGLTPADPDGAYRDVAVVVYDEHREFKDVDPEVWFADVAQAEWDLITRALQQPASLEEVSSFSSAVAQTLKANATAAVFLTILGILVYIWVRFGSFRYSLAAVVALVHDVTIALGLLAFSAWITGAVPGLANALRIEPFRIDLGVVAALLTIIGYSLNDTIVILDRIRENRGKLPLPTAPIVNRSINQTISRTVLTSFTTVLAVTVMYAEGGSGIRPFTYTMLVGLLVGTYSSVAIAAPLVYSKKPQQPRTHGLGTGETPIEPAAAGTS